MHTESGFTLIEILIAMVILSFGLLSLASMQIVAIRVNTSSDELSRGTTLVQDKIEQLMSLPMTHASLADPTPVGTCQAYTEADPPRGYTVAWCVDNTTTSVKTINVTASWYHGKYPKSFTTSVMRTTFQ